MTTPPLQDQIALVTGASSGIGSAVAIALAAAGAKVGVNYARRAWKTPEAEADLLRLIPYNRVGEPPDIGKAAVWLASDQSDYVNGITLFFDGGMTLYPGFAEGG